jgi:hypothetical protein
MTIHALNRPARDGEIVPGLAEPEGSVPHPVQDDVGIRSLERVPGSHARAG